MCVHRSTSPPARLHLILASPPPPRLRFVEQGRRQRLRRQARRLKADSALAVVRQEVHRLEAALAREQRELPLLQAQLVAVQRARWAGLSCLVCVCVVWWGWGCGSCDVF